MIRRCDLNLQANLEILAAAGAETVQAAAQPPRAPCGEIDKKLNTKIRRARIDFFKRALNNVDRSDFSQGDKSRYKSAIAIKIKEEKALLLDRVDPDHRGIRKLGSKYYARREIVKGDVTEHEYFQCDKRGRGVPDSDPTTSLMRGQAGVQTAAAATKPLSDFVYFYDGSEAEANDLLSSYPGRYLVRDLDAKSGMFSYAGKTGGRINLVVDKATLCMTTVRPSVTMNEFVKSLRQKDIRAYYKGLEKSPPPMPVVDGGPPPVPPRY